MNHSTNAGNARAAGGRDSHLDQERRVHEAFASARRRLYVPRPDLIHRLDRHVRSDAPPLLITGESGSGKSALVAYWAAEYRRRDPDAFVIAYHVGASSSRDTRTELLRRIALEIQERLGGDDDVPISLEELQEAFPFLLAEAATQRLLLVIDGANQLDRGSRDLEWLPEHFPPGVRLIITTLDTPTRAHRDGWGMLRLEPLSDNERAAISSHYLSDKRVQLDPERLARITGDAPSSNPLFLRTRLEEIRLFGSYEHLNQRIDRYLSASSLDELFDRVLERLEEEHGEKLAGAVLGAIWGSRHGLTEDDLVTITGCSREELSALLEGLEYHILRGDGRLRFFHDALPQAVERRYLASEESRRDVHRRLADFFEQKPADAIRARELPWQLQGAGELDRLASAIASIDILEPVMEEEIEYELFSYWLALGMSSEMPEAYRAAVDRYETTATDRSHLPSILGHVGELLRLCGRYDEALEFHGRAVDLCRAQRGEEHEEIASRYYQLANLLESRGDLQESEFYYRRAMGIQERLLGADDPRRARTIGSLANVVRLRGDFDRAETLYRNALRIIEKEQSRDDAYLVICINNLAGVLHDKGKYDEAKALYMRALQMWERTLGPDHPNTAVALNNLATLLFDLGDKEAASDMCERALGIWERSLGPHHPMIATVLSNWGGIIARDLPLRALELLERALAIHEKAYRDPHPDTAILLYSFGRTHEYAGNLDAAEDYFRRAYEMQRDVLGPDHVHTATALQGWGSVRRERGDYQTAEEMMREAVAIIEQKLGTDHPLVAVQTGVLASLLLDRGNAQGAYDLARKAIDILERVSPDQESKISNIAATLIEAERILTQSDDASITVQ